ncbi:NAD(P)H-quinone oxidoreductase [Cellulomonas sp. PhB143]|uniref:NAD(P)H-quinone oxidoreductase n=1 Tax=Cellulomonas sp. PhB143 TaxID=2485186 RepID=UPI000F475EE5|nr:NAD(P)H-quinone oxidoreductase [Cellulomonas sp. PhB143]ROS79199.1 putative PIG3 family NAD(P)H quinone oxidoreductase [Cellulomonas sp. PhB143]
MRHVSVSPAGSPANLAVVDAPDQPPGEDEVAVAVAAAGINRADLLQRAGHYPPPPGASDVLGLEVSGTVVDVGPGVSGWAPGDQVCALLDGGGYADRALVPAAQLLPVPDGVPLADAAALPEAVCTAWSNLAGVAHLAAGEWLLVHGGSGGVGTVAVQIGAALGAHVVATAGGPDRVERCRALGAELGVDHREQDFVEVVREASGGHGADVVLDVVGAAYLADNVRVLATGGRLVVIGMQQGRRGELDLGALVARRASVTGTTLRSRPAAEKAAVVAAVREHVWPMLADGRVRPVVHARLPLAEAAAAHELLDSGDVFGKVLLVP